MFDYAQKILDSPDAPRQIEALYQTMQNEKQRRHDFREWITPNIKAEFINGKVVLHPHVQRRHWKTTNFLSSILSVFVSIKKLGCIGTTKVMVALTRNDYEPDLVFYSKEKADNFTDDQLLFPAPDFVVEILSKSTASNDKNIKKRDYAEHGVREYWIVDPIRQRIQQYVLLVPTDKQFTPAKTFLIGDEIESRVIEGFTIPVEALFDEQVNIETLKNLIG